MTMRGLLDDILKDIMPTSSEIKKSKELEAQVTKKIMSALKNEKAEIICGGSYRKGTQTRDNNEIDFFVKFSLAKYRQKNISEILGKNLKKAFPKIQTLHGSRDYFQVKAAGYIIEIIPILGIKTAEQAENITDISPLHSLWVLKNSKLLRDEIRLTKAFMKAQGVYGAESYVRGFSGYAAEILTTHYGSFINVLKAAKKWKEKEVIDTNKEYKNRNALLELSKSKTTGPLILIDPVQKSRNVTAALSSESFTLFKKSADSFLKHPGKSFFEKKNITKEMLKHEKKHLLIITLIPKAGKKDVAGAAILTRYEKIKKKLEAEGFIPSKSSWQFDTKGMLWYYFGKLPEQTDVRKGPPSSDKQNAAIFRKKHKKTFTQNGRIYAKIQRTFKSPHHLAKHILSQKEFMKKIKAYEAEWHPL